MIPEEQALDASERCLNILRRYQENARTELAKIEMIASMKQVVNWMVTSKCFSTTTQDFIRASMKINLVYTYGLAMGLELYDDFAAAFVFDRDDDPISLLSYSSLVSSYKMKN